MFSRVSAKPGSTTRRFLTNEPLKMLVIEQVSVSMKKKGCSLQFTDEIYAELSSSRRFAILIHLG